MSLKGTRTAENLMKAYVGESQASRRYAFYAKVLQRKRDTFRSLTSLQKHLVKKVSMQKDSSDF